MKRYPMHAGGDLLEDLTDFMERESIHSAWLSYLGAVQQASLRYYDQIAKEYRDFHIHARLEVLSGVGNVSLLDGQPFIHTHAVFGDAAGRAFGGHVNVGTTVWAIEAEVRVLDGPPVVREHDDCTGLTLWGGTPEEPPPA